MKKASSTSLFQRESGIFYFRRIVPEDLRDAVGKREWKHSLGTRDRQEALKLAADLFSQTEKQIVALRGGSGSMFEEPPVSSSIIDQLRAQMQREARMSADRAISRLGMETSTPEKADAALAHYKEDHIDLEGATPLGVTIQSSLAEFIARYEKRSGSEVRLSPDQMLMLSKEWKGEKLRASSEVLERFTSGDITSSVRLQRYTLGRLLTEYEKAKSPEWSTKSSGKFHTMSRVLIELIGSSTELHSISRQMIKDAHETICKLPANYSKRAMFADKSISEVARIATDTGIRPIARTTAGDYLNHIKSFFLFAEAEGLIEKDPSRGLSNVSKTTTEERRPFSEEELDLLFAAPIFTGCEDDETHWRHAGRNFPRRAKFWVPLIALHSGMRLGEICGLRVGDVLERDASIWAFRLESHTLRRLKTKMSVRDVPVHKGLVDLGFVDWIVGQRTSRNADELLFDDITPSKTTGSLSDPFSKWFTKFRRAAGVDSPTATFHSFRHYFEDRLLDAGVALEINERLMGWSSARMQARYGTGPSLERANEAMQSTRIEVSAIDQMKR